MAETIRTACNRDCPDTCALLVQAENGVVTSVRGDPAHPLTRGFACFRTGRYPSRQLDRDRLRTPLVRRGDLQEPIGWDAAMDLIEARLRETLRDHGPAAVCSFQSGGSIGILKGLTDYFFRLLGPVSEFVGDICGGAGTAAQELDFGIAESHDVFDIANSRHVLLWGKNVGVSNIHLVPLLQECHRNGTGITIIDPIPPEAGLSNARRIAPRPGRDLELALGVARVVFERLGTPDPRVGLDNVADLRALCERRTVREWMQLADLPESTAHELADQLLDGPTSIQIGWGLQRRLRGGTTVRALDALAAISDNLGVPGGGASFYYWRRRAFHTELFETGQPPARTFEQALFGEELAAASDPRVRFLWISCGNPVASLPDSVAVERAITETDFSVAVDTHETDTTRAADLVLPAATMFEHGDLLGSYGHHWIQMSRPVVAPPDGVRSDFAIIQELGRRFGLESQLAGTPESWIERLLRQDSGVTLDGLRDGAVRNRLAEPVLFEGGRVATPNGRVQLMTASDYVEPDPDPSGAFPLHLFSNSHRRAQSSQWVRDERVEGLLTARVHPDSACGIENGAVGRLVGEHGQLQVRVVHDRRMRTDTVLTPKSGRRAFGRAANVLVPARLTDVGGGAAYLDVRVRLERVEGNP